MFPIPLNYQAVTNQQLAQIIALLGSIDLNSMQHTKINLTALQIQSLNTVPQPLIPAPGPGFAIQVISASVFYTFGTIAFLNTQLIIGGAGLATAQATSPVILTSPVSNNATFTHTNQVGNIADNTGMVISANADSVQGDGTAVVYVSYRVIQL